MTASPTHPTLNRRTTMHDTQATVVRVTNDDPGLGLTAGQVLTHEGTHEISGYPLASLPDGQIVEIDPGDCKVIEVAPVEDGSFHILVESGPHAGGLDPEPDLRDLVRLIEWLRDHEIDHQVAGRRGTARRIADRRFVDSAVCYLRVQFDDPSGRMWTISEGLASLGTAVYVGPDGALYDEIGEAL